MRKYKVEIEIEVDFDTIFAEIPDGLFSAEDKGSDKHYEIECIADVLRDAYSTQLMRQMKNMTLETAAYHKHHDVCSVSVAKQIVNNMKIKLI